MLVPLRLLQHQVPTSLPAHPELQTLQLKFLRAEEIRKKPLTMTVFGIAPWVTLWPDVVVLDPDSPMVAVAAPDAGKVGFLDMTATESRHGM
jgi:hypothetical protein